MISNVAMLFNGEYIENQIEGYTTESVSGREMLGITETTSEVGNRDGVIYQRKKYKSRTLTVGFSIAGDSKNSVLKDLELLSEILDVEQVEIVFNDESDLFYIGTRVGEPNVTAVNVFGPINAVAVGSFEILCSDPYKYSVEEYSAEPEFIEDRGFATFLVDYDGNHKAYPKYEVEFYSQNMITDDEDTAEDDSDHGDRNEALGEKGSCGYVAIFDDEKHILQFGNSEIEIPDDERKSELLISQSFRNYGSFSQDIQNKWLSSPFIAPSGYIQNGSYSIDKAVYSVSQPSITSKILSSKAGTNSKYSVSVVASSRTETSVKLKVTVKRTLTKNSTAGTKAKLTAGIYVGGTWHEKVILQKTKTWKKGTKSTSYSFTVNGLDPTTDVLSKVKFRVNRTGGSGSVGKLASTTCNNIQLNGYLTLDSNKYYLAPYYGTHSSNQTFHGPTIARQIPSDSLGDVHCENFDLKWTSKLSIGKNATDTAQCGSAYIAVLDQQQHILAGVNVRKVKSGSKADVDFYANGEVVTTMKDMDFAYDSKNELANERACSISKGGRKLSYNVFGKTYDYTLSDDFEGRYVIFGNFQYGVNPMLDWNGVCEVSLTRNYVEDNAQIPNPFHAGDILSIDTSTGEVLLNGVRKPGLGALGNDWETMCLLPGLNQISTAFSDWANVTAYRNCFESEPYKGDYYEEAKDEDGGHISEEEFEYDKTSFYTKSGSSYTQCTESSVFSYLTTYYTHSLATVEYYTKSGSTYTKCNPQPTEEQYLSNPTNYYILENCSPKFSMSYREVYL